MVQNNFQESSPFDQVKRLTLPNGLIVLLYPRHQAHTLSIYLAVKSGSSDENEWLGAGLSHFVEHMFFKGTPTRNKGVIEKEVREMGGYINAYTSHDITVFYLNTLSKDFSKGIDLMYDAAFNSDFNVEELEKERQVILAEQRMNEDNLSRKALVSLWELAFMRHPYRFPIIGYPDIFSSTSREDLMSFYRAHYIPNNMVLSVVGDIDLALVEKEVQEVFGKAKRQYPPLNQKAMEFEQISPRKEIFHADAQHSRLVLGFPGTPLSHPDAVAMDVLAHSLGGGVSSRLYQNIKEEQELVLDIQAFNSNLEESGLFVIQSLLLTSQIESARESIMKEIKDIQESGIDEDELKRVRNQSLEQYYSAWESNGSIAHDLITSEIYVANFRYSEQYLDLLKRIQSKDVQRVARKYLIPQSLNEVLLLPTKHASEMLKKSTAKALKRNPVEMFVMDTGLKALVLQDKSTPTITLQLAFKGGLRYESTDTNGASSLLAEMLLRGTSSKSQKDISDLVSGWGGDISGYSGQNSMGISLSCLSAYTEEAIGLLREVVTDSQYPEDEFRKVKQDQLEALLAEKESIYNYANQLLREELYELHPYRLNPLGTEESLNAMTTQRLRSFFDQIRNPEQMILAISGDIDLNFIKELTKKTWNRHFSSSQAASVEVPEVLPLKTKRQRDEVLVKEQTVLMIAFRAIDVLSKDRYAFQVLNSILDGSAGRLYQNIRGHHGLSYVIGSSLVLGVDQGYFVLYAGVEPSQKDDALRLLKEEIEVLKKKGVSKTELELAKTQLIGQFEHIFESKNSQMRHAVHDELYGLGFQEIQNYVSGVEKVSAEQIQSLARDYFDFNRSVQISVGPSSSLKNSEKSEIMMKGSGR